MTRTDPGGPESLVRSITSTSAVLDIPNASDDLSSGSAQLRSVDDDLWPMLDRLSRALHVKEAGLAETLEAVLKCVVRTIPAATFAGLNLLVKGKFEPQAVFGQPPHTLDILQQRTGIGPCVTASREQTRIEVKDMHLEARWPDYAGLALEVGVLSMLCVPLWVDDMRVGSLSLYGTGVAAFDEQAANLAGLLATHAALALADAQRTAHLRQALVSRDIIGQAKGILMAHQRLTADQAFELLSLASQHANRKLVEVAEVVAHTGALPTAWAERL